MLGRCRESFRTRLSTSKTDSGWAAYGILLAALLSEGVLIGVCLSFGVFQDYYSNRAFLPHSDVSSWIGVLATGIAYLGAPAVTYCCQNLTIPCHYYIYFGWILCLVGLLGSAFCHDVRTLIATQGLLFGLGLLVVEMPTLIILNTWFVERRGLAFGLLCGFTDLFGVAWGFLASALLNHHGIKAAFLVFAAICFFIPGVGIFFLRERPCAPAAADSCSETASVKELTSSADVEPGPEILTVTNALPFRRYYSHAGFYIFLLSNLVHSFALYLPFIYLPSYATALGYSASTGAVVLALANVAQVFGEIGFGRLSDKVNVHSLVFCSAAAASLAAFLIWGFASSLAYLIIFALLFGGSASGFLTLWPRIGTMFAEHDASMIYSFLSLGRGLGVISSGPISSALLQVHGDVGRHHDEGDWARHRYQGIVLFVGSCMAASAVLGVIGWISSYWKRKHVSQSHSAVV
ncbi:uncharacterized protein Z520_05953 [Fonsecaea multimorphosa CBS 102226]|uniref:Major facilitator superfamily (MFS) profile domain-containing protein n=1 Tax=Fonsecaea multimorphosa CBS 102226 TaxID=1442371 RepID=A0A0D2JYN6_9EURO|nr:uncharacterized protein Z520_05953 [Fonsecaea multimorphosa CBS 102226]KIX98652.1 hypothetical protein Z520_05953 [Fonsecaea multimorphosa CBS 102226]OAL24838.1 hypothetical protein AYO22_05627 [Fonsecaea multimorphosa]